MGISTDTALGLARFFSTAPQFWLNLQQACKLETEGANLAEAVEHIEPHAPVGQAT